MSQIKPFRVGFIGAGGIAHTHARNLKLVEGVTLVSASDVSEAGLEKFRKEQGVERTYRSCEEMLEKEKGNLDAVTVCTPNGFHAENAIAALKAGLHVMVEKPMAMTSRQCAEMNEAARKAGRHLSVGFQWRFSPKTTLLKRQADDGVFGKILYVRVQAMRRRGIPNWGVFGRKDLQGGGPLIDIGVHVSEMAHYVMGSPKPVSATGSIFTYLGDKPGDALSQWPNWDHKTYTVEDLAVGMVRFDDGAMMTIESSFCAHIEKDLWTFQIMGEKGGATFDPLQVFKDEHGYMWNDSPGYVPNTDPFALKMRHFVDVCRGEATNQSSGEAGLMVQQILDAIYLSAEKKREVRVDEIN